MAVALRSVRVVDPSGAEVDLSAYIGPAEGETGESEGAAEDAAPAAETADADRS